jgi:hypothetical protein
LPLEESIERGSVVVYTLGRVETTGFRHRIRNEVDVLSCVVKKRHDFDRLASNGHVVRLDSELGKEVKDDRINFRDRKARRKKEEGRRVGYTSHDTPTAFSFLSASRAEESDLRAHE